MSGKDNVDFLLEIVKGSTTTKQEQADYEPQVDGVCGRCEVEDVAEEDVEIREQPPKSPPLSKSSSFKQKSAQDGVWVVQDFDFYGNPIGEKAQKHRSNNVAIHHHQVKTSSPAISDSQMARKEYTTEFLDGSTAPSCLVDFSLCLMSSLICSGGPCLLQDANVDDSATKKSVNNWSSREETAKVESQLQMELEKIRKQKSEMEKWYKREIARQDADKTFLQLQMEQKLVSMMEARISLENEYNEEIAREVTEVRALVENQLDLTSPSPSDISEMNNTDTLKLFSPLATKGQVIPSGLISQPIEKDNLIDQTQNPVQFAVTHEVNVSALKKPIFDQSEHDDNSAVAAGLENSTHNIVKAAE